MSSVALRARRRPGAVRAAKVPRPSWGLGCRSTRPCASSRSTAFVTLAALTCSRSPMMPKGRCPALREREEHEHLVASKGELERPQCGVRLGQEHLLEPHDRSDHRHGWCLGLPPLGFPLSSGFDNRIERQLASLGHARTLAILVGPTVVARRRASSRGPPTRAAPDPRRWATTYPPRPSRWNPHGVVREEIGRCNGWSGVQLGFGSGYGTTARS